MRRYLVGTLLGALVMLSLTSCAQAPTPTIAPTVTPVQVTQAVSTPATAAVTSPSPLSASPVVAASVAAPTETRASSNAATPAATALPVTKAPAQPSPTVLVSAATPLPTEAPLPTSTATEAPPPTQALPANPDPATGQKVWAGQVCMSCHGQSAEGDFGPKLIGTGLSFDQVLATVRLGKGQMPAFAENIVSDLELRHIVAWLRSLAKPTPTPIARPTFPTLALSETWYFVNEMRIRADFAKDLPVRQTTDDAGRLEIVKTYSRDGLAQAAQVLDRANRALNEVPNEGVKAILRLIIDQTNRVTQLLNQALAENAYQAAWNHVAQAVDICRLDTLPWATQAVRDAGLVGTVRIRVVDQSGRPIPGAFATALTTHTPLGGQVNSSGVITFVNVAAVPALPVKAYIQGRVYHEINVNLSPDATVEGVIALPPLPGGNLAPTVSQARITPASGTGNAEVTLSVRATDPQGRLDLAADQIFALNPNLGLAFVLRFVGDDHYELQVRLPDLAPGMHTWYFFAVDHACHNSNIIPVTYQVR